MFFSLCPLPQDQGMRTEGKAGIAVQGFFIMRDDEAAELIRPPSGEEYDGY